jgi:hypothetical protein
MSSLFKRLISSKEEKLRDDYTGQAKAMLPDIQKAQLAVKLETMRIDQYKTKVQHKQCVRDYSTEARLNRQLELAKQALHRKEENHRQLEHMAQKIADLISMRQQRKLDFRSNQIMDQTRIDMDNMEGVDVDTAAELNDHRDTVNTGYYDLMQMDMPPQQGEDDELVEQKSSLAAFSDLDQMDDMEQLKMINLSVAQPFRSIEDEVRAEQDKLELSRRMLQQCEQAEHYYRQNPHKARTPPRAVKRAPAKPPTIAATASEPAVATAKPPTLATTPSEP